MAQSLPLNSHLVLTRAVDLALERAILQQQNVTLHHAERASIPITYTVVTVFPILAIFAVVPRFLAASKSKAGTTIDDWTICTALVPTVASCVWIMCTDIIDKSRIIDAFYHKGKKGDFTELDDPRGHTDALQWGPGPASLFYLSANSLIKLSILLLYRRLFVHRSTQIIAACGVVLIYLIWITFAVPCLLSLSSVGGLSDGVVFMSILIFAAINVLTDLILLLIPVPYVWRVKLSTARKFQVLGIFSLGSFYLFSSAIRLYHLAKYYEMLSFIFKHESNWYSTYTLAEFAKAWWMTWIWALIKPCTSIIAACLPTLRSLVDRRSAPRPNPVPYPKLSVPTPSKDIDTEDSTGLSSDSSTAASRQ